MLEQVGNCAALDNIQSLVALKAELNLSSSIFNAFIYLQSALRPISV